MQQYKKIFSSAFLILLGILFRTTWHLGPNVEFVTTATLLAAAYLGRGWVVMVVLSIMGISDLILGNSNIFIFTWSAYLVTGLMGYWGLKNQKSKIKNQKYHSFIKVIKGTSLGIVASLWFYLWTNFGVWLLDSWGMYPRTVFGLLNAYVLGLPFLKFNLLGNLIFVPVSFFLVEVSKNLNLNSFRQTNLSIKHKRAL